MCANRIMVHDSVYDQFTAKFSEQVRKMRGAYIGLRGGVMWVCGLTRVP